jgi:hypothetical protein
MKTLRAAIIAVLLFMVPAYAFSYELGHMRISLIEGDVQMKTPEADDWGYASVNTPLAEGDEVWVPLGSRAELQLNSGTYIRLDEDTSIHILSMDKDSSQFYISEGHAYIYYDAPRGSVIQIDTPDASTRAFNRAIFRIDISRRYTDVSVYKGYVETENRDGTTRVNAGDMVSLGEDTYAEVGPMGPPDEWERWNKKRNDRLYAARGESSRYLPVELRSYSYDLDTSGRWVLVPEYGYVWTPTVYVGASWSPYRDGRWIWRGGDYIWVGYEPWGWVPYHYGRWSFSVNIGWFWVPPVASAVYWGPGFVGWVRTPEYVAWVPLAPGEIYYGRGYYGPHSVNIININITEVNVTKVYKNVNINNGVTVVHRNTFNSGSPAFVNVDRKVINEKIFVRNNISVGAPDIKPSKHSFFTSGKNIPEGKLPPQNIRNIRVRELKESRRLTKDETRSVLNPDAKPKKMPLKTITAPRSPGREKPEIRQTQPEERRRLSEPEGGTVPRSERKQIMPTERERAGAPSTTPPIREERQQFKEERRRPSEPQVTTEPKSERKQQIMPTERERAGAPSATPPARSERQQFQPQERRKTSAPEVSPEPRSERRQIIPAERERTAAPSAAPPVRNERKQLQPQERRNTAAPQGAAPAGSGKQPAKKTIKKPAAQESGSEENENKTASDPHEHPQNR